MAIPGDLHCEILLCLDAPSIVAAFVRINRARPVPCRCCRLSKSRLCCPARRADRPRPRNQDDWRGGERPGPAARRRRHDDRDARRSRPMPQRLLALAAERQRRRLRARPADQHGRLEGPRAQSTRAFARNLAKLTRAPDRAVGRAALHRGGRARTDRRRHEPRQARRGDRPARGRLHPARRARSARANFFAEINWFLHVGRPRSADPGLPADRRPAYWLRRLLSPRITIGSGSSALLYFVLFPALLIDTLARSRFVQGSGC